ncbi:hypothetical protein EJ05DRAFT_467647 [Pseudovirgaria hyperparasitica]|uniref:Uncharacterized protein n=1 Tax=Pseudovirgaria hyperparasitica TaxID=470096 RepID=A0A6A6W2Z8_9PEZI|nr:uncharacterized protein EJ05DRAFT_467647 [Pseudovirgaria hyperparasitica]KAF2755411.1 hypothetical protein EJ05DRAFT_467647 [Pseudovirgaria hyperparasitica]
MYLYTGTYHPMHAAGSYLMMLYVPNRGTPNQQEPQIPNYPRKQSLHNPHHRRTPPLAHNNHIRHQTTPRPHLPHLHARAMQDRPQPHRHPRPRLPSHRRHPLGHRLPRPQIR